MEANKDKFRQCVLHNDMNSNNFLVVEKDGKKEFSVLDFGDMVNSWLPIEVRKRKKEEERRRKEKEESLQLRKKKNSSLH